MRTSLSQQIQNALMYTSTASNKLTEAQTHAVSGKRIIRPSDDVPGTNKALSLRSAINTVDQFANNITVSTPLLDATQNALQDMVNAVKLVRSKAETAAKPDVTGSEKQTTLQELDDILAQMVDIANTKHTDQYIFSGTATDTPAVQVAADGTYTYDGNSGQRSTQVLSWVSLKVNVPGNTAFNFDGSAGAGTTDLFTMVTQLKSAVKSGDVKTISAQLTNIDANLDNLLSNTAKVGSWAARMEASSGTLDDMDTRLQEMLSDTEDIDLAEAVVQLKTQENVYQAALAVTSRIMNLSLASMNS
ncbi:MAG: flagellar hook-associated protein FlgL [Armatimonadota bacterium]|nr:flagellar hook-associated protein FlgL [bacterium]